MFGLTFSLVKSRKHYDFVEILIRFFFLFQNHCDSSQFCQSKTCLQSRLFVLCVFNLAHVIFPPSAQSLVLTAYLAQACI
jgi:hypothetical protein